MRGCHDLNGRKNLNEKSGPGPGIGANKETRIGVKVCFLCKIFQSSWEGQILATARSWWRGGANPRGELTTSIIQPSSQTEQMPMEGLDLKRRHLRWWEPKVGFLLVLLDYRIVSREINLSGILTENDIIVRCGEGWLFTRWPPSQPHFARFSAHFVRRPHLCGSTFCAVLYDLWHWGTVADVTTWRSVDTGWTH